MATNTLTSIANSALVKLGAERIISIDDSNERARICKEQILKIRDALLRSHPWNFAIARVELAESIDIPAFEFGKKFLLPADRARILNVETGQYIPWQIEGEYLLTNSDTVKIRYVKIEEDVSKYDAVFVEVLALMLAADIAYSVVQSVTLKDTLKKEAMDVLRTARSFDAQEGTPQRVTATKWTNARF